jgi:hypothetical protein
VQLLAIILMAVGAAGASNIMSQFSGNTLPTGIVVIGVFILLISLFGCVGAWKENKMMLMIYAVVVVILVICQIATAIAIYSQQSQIPVILTVAWDNANNFLKVNAVQNPLQCCGLTVFNQTTGASGIAGQPCPANTAFTQQTCMLVMQQTIQSSFTTVGIVSMCFAFLQIIGIGFAVCLIRGIKLARDQDQMSDQAVDTPTQA